MNLSIYSVKDVVANQFSDIKIFSNDELAKRWFTYTFCDSKIKQDLQLFYLGSYDILTGAIDPHVDFIMGGSDL